MVRVIGLSKLRGVYFSLLAGGIGLAVACSGTSREFGHATGAQAGEAGAMTADGVDGGAGGAAATSEALGGDNAGSSDGSSAGTPGEEGGAPQAQDGPPVVVSLTPEDASGGAEPSVSVKITFSEPLRSDTATLDSVKLFDGEVEVEGEVRYADRTVTFTPVTNLSLLASYRVSLSTELTDSTGSALEAPFSASFRVRDGVWSTARTDLSPDGAAVSQVSAAADGRGNLLFAWVQAGAPQTVAARWYHSGIGWDPAAQTMGSGTVGLPTVATSPEGDAVVVWTSGLSYFAKRYLSGTWEGTAKKVGGAASGTLKQAVASIRHARALVAWPLGVANDTHFTWSTHANSASGEGAWQAEATQVWATTVDNLSVRDPSLKQDASGDGLFVFELAKTSFRQLYFATFANTGATWSAAAALDGTTGLVTDTGQGYSLAVTDAGDALVAWALKGKLMAGRYTKTKGFATPVEIDALEADPLIAVSGGAQALGDDFLVGWTQLNGVPTNAYANRYVATDKAWQGPKLLSDGVASASPPVLGVDRHGGAHAVWLQATAPAAPAVAARFSNGEWAKPVPLDAGKGALTNIGLCSAGSGQAASILVGAEAIRYSLFE